MFQNPYMGGYAAPYCSPPMADNLAQLRAGQMNAPMAQHIAPPQIGVVEVSGENEAAGYLVASGASVLLWWKEGRKFFLKSRDVNGSPLPMKTMTYTEDDTSAASQPLTEYITRTEFNGLAERITELEQAPKKIAQEAKFDV